MAVQAQYPSNAFSPDFRTRMQNNLSDEELQMLQGRDGSHHHHQQLLGDFNHGATPLIFSTHNNDNTVFSNPQSELTCIASGSKKRIIEEPSVMVAVHHTPVAFGYPNPDQTRLIESAGTSTSGRTCSSPSPIAQDLVAYLYHHQSLEIDAMIRLQNERLRLGLEQAQKRHCRALISALEQQVLKKLREKEMELENASKRNAELEEKVRQMISENQIWFNIAKNNEVIVSSLRTSLEQVLLQNTVTNAVDAKEGYGDSEGTVFPADDAQSCCFVVAEEERTTNGAVRKAAAVATECCQRKCRVCGEKDVTILLLPCRHFCLCKTCELKVDTCPICHVTKNACLQISLS